MCTLYPRYNSCCGIPVRIALIFIAILSIVTGAIINAVLKKAGVNVSSIQDVKLLKNLTSIKFEESNDTLLSSRPENEYKDIYQHVETSSWKSRRAQYKETTIDEKKIATIEILREDGQIEVIRYLNDEPARANAGRDIEPEPQSEDEVTDPADTEDTTEHTDSGEHEKTTSEGEASSESSGENTSSESSGENIASELSVSTSEVTTEGSSTSKNETSSNESLFKAVGYVYVNQIGLNFLAMMFIALGILLLVANFLNSPDLALVYVVLMLATDLAALLLLVGVVTECTTHHDTCVLQYMDWFSAFMVTLFWFMYIFVWAFFVAIANSFANGGVGNTL